MLVSRVLVDLDTVYIWRVLAGFGDSGTRFDTIYIYGVKMRSRGWFGLWWNLPATGAPVSKVAPAGQYLECDLTIYPLFRL